MGWKERKQLEKFRKLFDAVQAGHISEDEIEPDHIVIPEHPDPKWTDKPREKNTGYDERDSEYSP